MSLEIRIKKKHIHKIWYHSSYQKKINKKMNRVYISITRTLRALRVYVQKSVCKKASS
jgi:hypothetical protein